MHRKKSVPTDELLELYRLICSILQKIGTEKLIQIRQSTAVLPTIRHLLIAVIQSILNTGQNCKMFYKP